jgi:hypothetical protein
MPKLYRYHAVTKTVLGNLAAGKVWASQPSAFNDPFEFRLKRSDKAIGVDQLRSENSHLSNVSDIGIVELAAARFEEEIQKMGVVCYTSVPDSLLMWAHYASDHRGICVEYTFDRELSDAAVYPVEYTDSYPELNFQDIWHREGLARVLWAKSRHWAYEQEYRSIVVEGNKLCDLPGRLTKVLFGLRTTLADRDLVQSVIPDASVEYQRAELHPEKYALEFGAS